MSEPRPLRVLLVEDSPDDAELVLLELRRAGYEVQHERVDTELAMRVALETATWDLVLSDCAMPRFSSAAALELVHGLGIDVPFIIVSGSIGEETAVEAMKAGAHDYVLKGSLARLVPAIARETREARLRARQKELQQQLLISERMASVGTLAAAVAHEINTPLAVTLANLELLDQELGPARTPAISEQLRDARDGATRVRDIVRDLKLFSRAADDRTGPVSVHAVLETSLRMAWHEIRHRARLDKVYAAELPSVKANESRLGQVFLNLIVNAAQSMPVGAVDSHTLRVVTALDALGRVVISVGDNGCGIPRASLPRIFDPFYTTKPIGLGTGLGLSICHRIVSDLGGEILVDSQVGVGSTFRVVLPAADLAGGSRDETAAPQPATRRARVLVIDDEPMLARAIGRGLGLEHEVTVSSSGADALARIAGGERFDLILCDLIMPEVSGMEVHAELDRSAPELARRLVFMTGGAFTPATLAFLERIGGRYLQKPFEMDELRRLVDEQLRQ